MTSTEPKPDTRGPRQPGFEGTERQAAKRPMNPVLRVLAALLGLAAIFVAGNGTYDVLKSVYWDVPAALGILAMLCGGCAFVVLGLTGKG